MKRYIDADLVKKDLQSDKWIDKNSKMYIMLDIDEQPIADVAEVVRCKDCKYWQGNNNGYPCEECRWGKGETPDEDDFCSYGERKENEH